MVRNTFYAKPFWQTYVYDGEEKRFLAVSEGATEAERKQVVTQSLELAEGKPVHLCLTTIVDERDLDD